MRFSGPGTPVPPDAPPSVKATSSARKQVRAEHKRRFPRIDYTSRVSHFDPKSDYTNFRGFFVLFWIGLAIMVITAALRNLKETGYLLSFKQRRLFTKNIWELAVVDLAMVGSTALSLPMHKVFKNSKGLLKWSRGGMAAQSLFQAVWLVQWVRYVDTTPCESRRGADATTQLAVLARLDLDRPSFLYPPSSNHVHEDALVRLLQRPPCQHSF